MYLTVMRLFSIDLYFILFNIYIKKKKTDAYKPKNSVETYGNN